MSDASMPRCDECNEPVYACTCIKDTCLGCGAKLSREAVEQDSKLCFDCYLWAEG